jgi:molecular chaperone DnaK (HSP70)
MSSGLGAHAAVRIGSVTLPLIDLVSDFLRALRTEVLAALPKKKKGGDATAAISVPANSHSTQRFVTLEAFRAAGFEVKAMINEPSAAGLEYAHRHAQTLTSRREHVVIYDLGGGTFDAALVYLADGHHDVVTSSGIARLGGDDFDRALLELALARATISPDSIPEAILASLSFECRTAKEGIHPNTRRVVIELAALGDDAPSEPIVISVADYYEAIRPLVERSLEALEPVIERAGASEREPAAQSGDPGLAGLYVVGGASGLPLVPRLLRERFGRRVHRSPHSAAATAIGLAIAAESAERSRLHERFTRHLGVFRERDAGERVSFDRIFGEGTAMPAPGEPPLVAVRAYRAAHNVGHFRFIECGGLDDDGHPAGDITPHASIRFPFVGEVADSGSLADVPVVRLDGRGPAIEERYEVDAGGIIAVTLTNLDTGRHQRFVL